MSSAEIAHDLLRKLLKEVRREDSGILLATATEPEVLFDDKIDGVRYVLLRTCAQESARPLLSPREHEIARMVAKGLPNKTIASVLEISGWTVSSHLRRIFTKLGVNSRAAMVARILAIGHLENKQIQHPAPIAQGSVEVGAQQISRQSASIP